MEQEWKTRLRQQKMEAADRRVKEKNELADRDAEIFDQRLVAHLKNDQASEDKLWPEHVNVRREALAKGHMVIERGKGVSYPDKEVEPNNRPAEKVVTGKTNGIEPKWKEEMRREMAKKAAAREQKEERAAAYGEQVDPKEARIDNAMLWAAISTEAPLKGGTSRMPAGDLEKRPGVKVARGKTKGMRKREAANDNDQDDDNSM